MGKQEGGEGGKGRVTNLLNEFGLFHRLIDLLIEIVHRLFILFLQTQSTELNRFQSYIQDCERGGKIQYL